MTLYDLANATTIQGNVEVAVIEDGLVQRHYFYHNCDDLAHAGFDCEAEDIDEMEVVYIYPDKASDGRIWLVIEVTEEVDL